MRVEAGPKVLFSQIAWQKQWALVHSCGIEISWFGYCMPQEQMDELGIDANFYVEDIYVVDQECTGVKSDMDPDAVSKLCVKLMDEGKDPSRLKLWGHSHVNMDVGFSGTDEATIDRLELEPLISIVLNKKGDVNIRVDQWEPWRHSFDADYEVEEIQMIENDWGKQMVDAHVTRPKVVPIKKKGKPANNFHTTRTSQYQTWGSDPWHWHDPYEPPKARKKDVLEDAMFDIALPEELGFLEDGFLEGHLSINDLLEAYAAWKNNGEMTEILACIDKESLEKIIADYDAESDPNEDPFYVNENPTSLQSGVVVNAGAKKEKK